MITIKKTILLLTLCLLALSGCQKFSSVKIEQQHNELQFNFSAIGNDLDGNRQYILYDIGVSRHNCSSDSCVVWETIRKAEYFDSLDHPLANNSILYGSNNPAMKTTVSAKTLTNGEYSVAASIGLLLNGEFHKTYKIFENFKITISGNNSLTVLP